MGNDLIDVIRSLGAVLGEETQRLHSAGRSPELAELAAAKQRLVAALEARLARLSRECPGWPASLEREERTELADALGDLLEGQAANAAALERHISLTLDLLGAILAEARRLGGTRHAVYGSRGGLLLAELPTPISINSSF